MGRKAETGVVGQGVVEGVRRVLVPLVVGAVETRRCLLQWVHAQGLETLDELFGHEAAALAARRAGGHAAAAGGLDAGLRAELGASATAAHPRGEQECGIAWLVAATRGKLAAGLTRRLDEIGERTLVTALGITVTGEKVPLGL